MTDQVRQFYNDHAQEEWLRPDDAYSRIEYLSAMQLIYRYFPSAGRIIDIGGGPGRYSIVLLQAGYEVTLLDLAEENLTLAKERFRQVGKEAKAVLQGDACHLDGIDNGSFDAALMMGPLYHLHDSQLRHDALAELYRVLKDGGIAIVAYLNSWGLIRTGLADFPNHYENETFLKTMMDEGSLGIWYWSNPIRAQAEIKSAGFEMLTYAGAEGCVGGTKGLVIELAEKNPVAYENIVQLAVHTSELAQFRDGADHLLFVIRKGITS